jgi:PPP family 3-phenylpropionic acid transporter
MTAVPASIAARAFGLRSALFCGSVFAAVGILLPFFPVWLAAQGLSAVEVAAIVAAPSLVRVVSSPALVATADRFEHLGRAAVAYAGAATAFFLLLAPAQGFWPILTLSAGALVFWNALTPLADAVIVEGVRRHGLDYARTRLWGSVAFILGSFAAAAAARAMAADGLFLVQALAFSLGILAALALPKVGGGLGAPPAGFARALRDPVLRGALLAAGLVMGSHGAYYAFGSLYWRGLGFGETTVAGLWAFSVAVEVALFWAAKTLVGWDARRFLLAGGAGATVRWLLFPVAVAPLPALALQALHALSFAATHLGVMMAIAARASPGHTARLQASHALISGLLLAAATLGAGPLFAAAPSAAFAAMALLGLCGLLLALRLPGGLQPQSAGGGGDTSAPT